MTMKVFVILVNARTDNEGIHTIQMGDRNMILMFASEDDATRYALMLEAQDFPPCSIEKLDEEEVIEFCRDTDYDWKLVPENSNSVFIPPENNIEETDWKPEGKQQFASENREFSDAELNSLRRRLEGLL